MKLIDIIRYALKALSGYPTRTGLMLLAMAIGVGSVVVLSALGEGARRYVVGEFSSLGTNLLIVLPGRSETVGGPPPLLGITPRDLTLDDAKHCCVPQPSAMWRPFLLVPHLSPKAGENGK